MGEGKKGDAEHGQEVTRRSVKPPPPNIPKRYCKGPVKGMRVNSTLKQNLKDKMALSELEDLSILKPDRHLVFTEQN
jgi:hypothetical protein